MSAEIIYGNVLAKEMREEMKQEVDQLRSVGKRIPCLAVILAGNNPASLSYIKGKEKACQQIGIDSCMFHLDENCSQSDLEKKIRECNEDENIDGILVQLPLPEGLNEDRALKCIEPKKDVDGLHPENVGKLFLNKKGFVPCTPKGVIELLKRAGCDFDGRRAVVIGRSKLVGSPVARLLQNENATVTICHSHTKDVRSISKEADIVVVAVGKPKLIDASYIKKGAYVIDVGVNRLPDGHLCGDCDFDSVKEIAGYVTPVPKGVGPMTITMLLKNTMEAYFSKGER